MIHLTSIVIVDQDGNTIHLMRWDNICQ